MKDKKDAVIIARVPKELKKKIEEKAVQMKIKVSEVTRLACEKFLK